MTLRVASAPIQGLVTRDEAKVQCKVEIEDVEEDTFFDGLILTATSLVEATVQRRYVQQTLEWVLPYWRACMRLPLAPVAPEGVSKIEYVDEGGVLRTLDPSSYVVAPDGDTVSIRPRRGGVWPLLDEDASEPVKITFVVGGAPAAISPLARHAAMLIIAHYYKNREAVVRSERTASAVVLPLGVDDLLISERWA